jgi:hypothetical protein
MLNERQIRKLDTAAWRVHGPCGVQSCFKEAGFEYSYPISRAGRRQLQWRHACRGHAEKYAKSHGLAMPEAGAVASVPPRQAERAAHGTV